MPSLNALGRTAALVVLVLLFHTPVAEADCGPQKKLSVPVSVYSGVPNFSTGKGWSLAPKLATLPAGSSVALCEERSVGIFLSKKTWLKIKFTHQGDDRFGWIPKEALQASQGPAPHDVGIIGSAYAADGDADTDTTALGLPNSVQLYVFMFAAVILGMGAKGVFDCLGNRRVALRQYFTRTIRSFLVSPIVFLGMASGGDFVIATTGSLMIFLCMAFQNGFFWQTVLVKTGGTT